MAEQCRECRDTYWSLMVMTILCAVAITICFARADRADRYIELDRQHSAKVDQRIEQLEMRIEELKAISARIGRDVP